VIVRIVVVSSGDFSNVPIPNRAGRQPSRIRTM